MLKSRIATHVHNSFKRRDGSNRYIHIKVTGGNGYFIDKVNPDGDNLYTADEICRIVEFLIYNINLTQYAEVSNRYRCKQLIQEENRYIHIKITGGNGYFKDTINLDEDNLYTVHQICGMVEFSIDNINQTQYAEVSNSYTCTQLIQEERWK